MNITTEQLLRQHRALGVTGRRAMRAAAAPHPHVDQALVEAIASRETNMRNIVGDGGHGRGIGQQDDRWLPGFLSSVRGCRSGSSLPVFGSALPKGRVPTISTGAKKIAAVIEANIAEATRAGVPAGHRTKVAVSGYNAGITGAIHAFKHSGNSDAATTGGDYADDVLARAAILRKVT